MGITFSEPEFIAGNSPEEIQRRMMENLPSGIDDLPGGFPWDFTMPTALEKSELINYYLVRTLMLMFPMWAWGEWLDYHANECGLSRKAATYAECALTIIGVARTAIPAGSQFATVASQASESLFFHTKEEVSIGSNGQAQVQVYAEKSGKDSNVAPDTIILMGKPVMGIKSVSNKLAATGGTEEESDDELRERIQDANRTESASFVGNDSDYRRWAKEVAGVGDVIVIPEKNGPGSVQLVIMDANGSPANEAIRQKVYNYIVSPSDRMSRKAPIGATVTVIAPETVIVKYVASVDVAGGYSLEAVISQFREQVQTYYSTAQDEGVLKYIRVCAILSDIPGVNDFRNLKINDGTGNVIIQKDKCFSTGSISF